MPPRWSRRLLLLCVVLLAHAIVLWLLAGARPRSPPEPPVAVQVALAGAPPGPALASRAGQRSAQSPAEPAAASPATDAPNPAALSPAPPIPTPTSTPVPTPPPDATVPELSSEPVELDPAAAAELAARVAAAGAGFAQPAGDGGCGVESRITLALARDPTSRAVLAAVPAAPRSVADAVMIWNGVWADQDLVGGSDALRRVIRTEVRALPSTCRERPLNGPRFLVLAGASGPTVLAIGSGDWRWSDLLR